MPPYFCYFCHKSFSQKEVLRKHFKNRRKCKFNKYDTTNNLKTEISHDDMVLMFESGEYHHLFLDIEIPPYGSKTAPYGSKTAPYGSKMLHMDPNDTQIISESLKKNKQCEQ